MLACWSHDRPHFGDIHAYLRSILDPSAPPPAVTFVRKEMPPTGLCASSAFLSADGEELDMVVQRDDEHTATIGSGGNLTLPADVGPSAASSINVSSTLPATAPTRLMFDLRETHPPPASVPVGQPTHWASLDNIIDPALSESDI